VQDWSSIFEGHATAARDLASELEAQGLRSFVEDRQGPVVSRAGSRANYSVVLVPPEEAERAAQIAQRWESSNRRDTNLLANRLMRVVGISLIAPIAWLIGAFVAPQVVPEPKLAWLGGMWLVALVVVAQIENRRHQREHIRSPAV
jgi:hypothetical protein